MKAKRIVFEAPIKIITADGVRTSASQYPTIEMFAADKSSSVEFEITPSGFVTFEVGEECHFVRGREHIVVDKAEAAAHTLAGAGHDFGRRRTGSSSGNRGKAAPQ